MERLEELSIIEDIDRIMFDKYRTNLIKEKQEIEKQLDESGTKVSNLEKCIDPAMNHTSKLNTM